MMRRLSRPASGAARQRCGSVLVVGLMTVSAMTLVSLGAIATTLGEQVRTMHMLRDALALQRAHAGIELALWEMNHGGVPPFSGAEWVLNGGEFTRTIYQAPGSETQIRVDEAGNPRTITAVAIEQGVTRTISIDVPGGGSGPPPARGPFDYVIYTQNYRTYLYGQAGATVEVDGYDSDRGPHNTTYISVNPATGNRLDPNQVLISSDGALGAGPWRQNGWNTLPPGGRAGAAQALVVDGNVTLFTDVEVGSPEVTETPPIGYSSTDPGHAVYDPVKFPEVAVGSVTLHGAARQNPRTTAPTFPPVTPPASPTGLSPSIDPSWVGPGPGQYSKVVICPSGANPAYYNDTATWEPSLPEDYRTLRSINLAGATLVIGCSDAAGEYSCSDRCPSETQAQPITLSIGDGNGQSGLATHALKVEEANAVAGKIIVYNPTQIHAFAEGPSGGFLIASNGIENAHMKSGSLGPTSDPSALKSYIHSGADFSVRFTTTQDFYGALWGQHAIVDFDTSDLDFFGSLHAKEVRTDNAMGIRIHWDLSLLEGPAHDGPPPPPSGCTPGDCRPIRGSWTVQ